MEMMTELRGLPPAKTRPGGLHVQCLSTFGTPPDCPKPYWDRRRTRSSNRRAQGRAGGPDRRYPTYSLTTACKRRGTASACASLRLFPAPEAPCWAAWGTVRRSRSGEDDRRSARGRCGLPPGDGGGAGMPVTRRGRRPQGARDHARSAARRSPARRGDGHGHRCDQPPHGVPVPVACLRPPTRGGMAWRAAGPPWRAVLAFWWGFWGLRRGGASAAVVRGREGWDAVQPVIAADARQRSRR